MAGQTYQYILDFKGKTDQITKEVGGLKGMLKGAAMAAGALFAADKVMDAARAVADYAKEISGVRDAVRKLTGEQGASLDKITGGVQAIAKAYGQDVNESVKSTNAIMKAFGATGEEAFNAMNKGFAGTANANGDFNKQIQEFSQHFAEAGLSAGEMVAVMSEGAKDGVFDNKAADTIKEGTIRLREMSQGTKDAINGIGLSSDVVQAAISSNSMDFFDVMQLVSKQLKTLPEQSPAVGKALADIFGGPGEDAVQFVRSLGDMNISLDDSVKNSGEAAMAAVKYGEELQKFHTIGAQVFGGTSSMITSIKATMMEWLNASIQGIVSFINYFIDLYNESMIFRAGIEYIALLFKNIWEVVKVVFNNIINYLSGLGKILKAVFTGNFGEISGIIADTFKNVIEDTSTFGKNVADNFMKGVENTLSPSRKIEAITLSSSEAEKAGEKTGNDYAKGVVAGMATGMASRPQVALLPTLTPKKGSKVNSGTSGLVSGNKKLVQSNTDLMDSYLQLGNVSASAFSSIGAAVGGAAEGWINFASTVFSQVTSVISTITSLMAAQVAASATIVAAKEGETMAVVASGAAKLPFPFNLIAIGAGIAAVASIWSAIPKAEFGGIVPGNSFTGDKQMIRVNSGEEVLRRDDPRHSLNQRGMQGGGSVSYINFAQDGIEIDGTKLRILLKKVERRVNMRTA